jgi:hypothetical protein
VPDAILRCVNMRCVYFMTVKAGFEGIQALDQ